jgi:hypothetical protein
LRIGCAWFIFVWAANKVFAPQQYVKLAKYFDGIDLGLTQVYAIAGIQIVICLLVFVGLGRIVSYGALAAMHGFTIFRQWPQYLDPFLVNDDGFPVNRNVTVALCAFLAMLALWLLRHRDHWSLDVMLARRKSANR